MKNIILYSVGFALIWWAIKPFFLSIFDSIRHAFAWWWHKVTWDDRMERENDYGDILGNLFGTLALLVVSIIVCLGFSSLVKIWLGFILS